MRMYFFEEKPNWVKYINLEFLLKMIHLNLQILFQRILLHQQTLHKM